MPFQFKKLALAAALALGGVTATDVVPVPQAQAEKEVQRDVGDVKKFLRAAALQGRELQRGADASSVVPDAKPRDGSPDHVEPPEPFLHRQLTRTPIREDGKKCTQSSQCRAPSECHFLAGGSDVGFCGHAPRGEMCGDRLPCRPGDLCLPPEAGSSAEVCVDPDEHAAQLEHERVARIDAIEAYTKRREEEFAVALLEQLEQPDTTNAFVALINRLGRDEFLNLVLNQDEAGRAALTGARRDYRRLFHQMDLRSIPLGGERTTSASDLGLSEWQFPEIANLSGMFMSATNVPDLSHWTLSAENTVYQMFIGVQEAENGNGGMTYGMCPCIDRRRCCPSLFGHGDACELKMEEQDECGSQR